METKNKNTMTLILPINDWLSYLGLMTNFWSKKCEFVKCILMIVERLDIDQTDKEQIE